MSTTLDPAQAPVCTGPVYCDRQKRFIAASLVFQTLEGGRFRCGFQWTRAEWDATHPRDRRMAVQTRLESQIAASPIGGAVHAMREVYKWLETVDWSAEPGPRFRNDCETQR